VERSPVIKTIRWRCF